MNKAHNWYSTLIKPTWAPPSWLFGPVWTILYAIIAVSFGAVFYRAIISGLSWIIIMPFVLNLVFNFSFTTLQFGLKNNLSAAIDILFVFGTLIWAMIAIYSYAHWITYAQIPYLLWVTFATILQLTITYLNR